MGSQALAITSATAQIGDELGIDLVGWRHMSDRLTYVRDDDSNSYSRHHRQAGDCEDRASYQS